MAKLTAEQKAEMAKLKAIPNDEMKTAIAGLNDFLKSKESEVMPKAKSKGEAVKLFTDSINSLIESDMAEEIPEKVAQFFNDHIVGDDADPEPEEEKPTPKPKKAAAEKDAFGNRIGTGAAKINALLVTGNTLADMVEKVGTTKSRVNSHMKHLQDKGFFIVNTDKILTVVKEKPAAPKKEEKAAAPKEEDKTASKDK